MGRPFEMVQVVMREGSLCVVAVACVMLPVFRVQVLVFSLLTHHHDGNTPTVASACPVMLMKV